MSRTWTIAAAILGLGLVLLVVAARMLLGPYQEDAKLGRELTRVLTAQGDLAEGTDVRVQGGRRAGKDTLAPDGMGLIVDVVPSPDVAARRGGLGSLAHRLAGHLAESYGRTRYDWIEMRLALGEAHGGTFRTLLRPSAEGRFLAPNPPLPR